MENYTNPMGSVGMQNMPKKSMLPIIILVIVLIALVLVGVWYFLMGPKSSSSNVTTPTSVSDSTTSINSDLNSIDVVSVEGDFLPVDNEINSVK